MRCGRLEAKSSVEAGIAFHEDEGLPQPFGLGNNVTHQRRSDALTLAIGSHGQRRERDDAMGRLTVVKFCVADHHVPDDLTVALGDEGQFGNEVP